MYTTYIEPRTEHISPANLVIDERAQRALNQKHRDTLASGFNPRKVGAVIISERENGDWYIMDGQHRCRAAAESGYTGTVPAVIHTGLSLEEEADLFLSLNETKIVQPLDKFKARVTAGRTLAVNVNNIVESLGFRVAPTNQTERSIAAVGALEKVYTTYGGDALTSTLVTIDESWPELPTNARGARIIEGIGYMLGAVPGVTARRLVSKLRTTSAGNIIADVDFLADIHKRPKNKTMVDVLVALYNKGLKKDQQVAAPE